jgi:hypothetical protein
MRRRPDNAGDTELWVISAGELQPMFTITITITMHHHHHHAPCTMHHSVSHLAKGRIFIFDLNHLMNRPRPAPPFHPAPPSRPLIVINGTVNVNRKPQFFFDLCPQYAFQAFEFNNDGRMLATGWQTRP